MKQVREGCTYADTLRKIILENVTANPETLVGAG